MTDPSSIAEAWRVEAPRRSAEIDSGLLETISAEEVSAAVCKLLKGEAAQARELEQTIALNVAGILEA